MTPSYGRGDTSIIGRWWWTIDRWTLAALFVLMAFGAVLIVAASPAVSERIGLATFSLAKRQLVLQPLAIALMLGVSLFNPRWIRRFGVLGLIGSLVLLILTPFVGTEIKGAVRWIDLGGFSIQASEFAKPCFAVATGWMFALGQEHRQFPGWAAACALWALMVALLLMQPDLGQTVVISTIFGVEFFLAGLPWFLVIAFAIAGLAGIGGAYFLFPHVAQRIDSFLDPAAGDRYQIDRSMEAFADGGLFGLGPGEGRVKEVLPDAHADFVFAVCGEELGLLACLLLVALFAFVMLRGFGRALRENNLFVLLSAAGLFTQFGLQALINMSSSLHLIPTKGMTLPFVSYGGSSLIALSVGMGMALALTRRNAGQGGQP
ncbi:cell division protein FtsW [Tistlia consotensis]|uniref:Probable peptidoglycan glycosyltransferase FtsW n=1 Tax=Tistlia consotensis USBA 355 TaxID=560819 RepID=A0A1Y6CJT5_9PROT|nr:putative peptidoglycan glycosyltransferase FtsW [Tistlia consotensis]SMF71014.1 cell division protein FtsW [Tistlia consotensis USBA 355]SNS06997.1 cell division protein FtsW [Tistlia consotensis]